jgi:hypothetical protein
MGSFQMGGKTRNTQPFYMLGLCLVLESTDEQIRADNWICKIFDATFHLHVLRSSRAT